MSIDISEVFSCLSDSDVVVLCDELRNLFPCSIPHNTLSSIQATINSIRRKYGLSVGYKANTTFKVLCVNLQHNVYKHGEQNLSFCECGDFTFSSFKYKQPPAPNSSPVSPTFQSDACSLNVNPSTTRTKRKKRNKSTSKNSHESVILLLDAILLKIDTCRVILESKQVVPPADLCDYSHNPQVVVEHPDENDLTSQLTSCLVTSSSSFDELNLINLSPQDNELSKSNLNNSVGDESEKFVHDKLNFHRCTELRKFIRSLLPRKCSASMTKAFESDFLSMTQIRRLSSFIYRFLRCRIPARFILHLIKSAYSDMPIELQSAAPIYSTDEF